MESLGGEVGINGAVGWGSDGELAPGSCGRVGC